MQQTFTGSQLQYNLQEALGYGDIKQVATPVKSGRQMGKLILLKEGGK